MRGTATVALGVMHESVLASGETQTNGGNISYSTTNTGGIVLPGGIFAQSTNAGWHSRNRFAVVPEGTITAGYNLTGWARLTVGYSLIYLSSVARPGDQLNRDINTTLTGLAAASRASGGSTAPSGPVQPTLNFTGSDFLGSGRQLWAGISLVGPVALGSVGALLDPWVRCATRGCLGFPWVRCATHGWDRQPLRGWETRLLPFYPGGVTYPSRGSRSAPTGTPSAHGSREFPRVVFWRTPGLRRSSHSQDYLLLSVGCRYNLGR